MKQSRWIALALVGALSLSTVAAAQDKGGTDDTGPYRVVANWAKPTKAGWVVSGAYSAFAETPNRIYATYVGERDPATGGPGPNAPPPRVERHMVVIYDGTGKVIDDWKQCDSMFVAPHYITQSPYDPDKNVWVVDRDGSRIVKFSNDGKRVLMVLGEKRVEKADATHFGRPAAIAFMPDGSFYVADGYVNRRIAKFDKNGKFLLQWGSAGSGPGQFAAQGQVHSIAIDGDHKIYVGDRGNRRVQIFDENGKFLDMWPIRRPLDVLMAGDQHLWVSDLDTSRILEYDLNGKYLYGWGTGGSRPGNFACAHSITVDSERNFYIGECFGGRVQKFQPKPNADPAKVIVPPQV